VHGAHPQQQARARECSRHSVGAAWGAHSSPLSIPPPPAPVSAPAVLMHACVRARPLREQLEKGSIPAKIDCMKKTIMMLMNGEILDGLLMTIIRFVLPQEDHGLKKLCLIYLEIVDKVDSAGKLLPEFILVCNQILNDLNHPNEYIRGCTLRFVSKMKEQELIEPWVAAVKACLEHRHSFVRRNAVLSIHTMYEHNPDLIPDGPDIVEEFLRQEQDLAPRRNAFLMLFQTAQDRAVAYLEEVLTEVSDFGEPMQLLILELIKRVCRSSPLEKAKYVRVIFNFLSSPASAVQYEAACTLVSLSKSATALRAATGAFCKLLAQQSDNNIKLIVLDRLLEIKKSSKEVLQEMLMDILKVLSSPNLEIRRKVLDICMDLVNPSTIDEVVGVLKKEVMKTQTEGYDKNVDYRQLLIQCIHQCAVKFPDVAGAVVHLLMDFLGDASGQSAIDVVFFLREIVEAFPMLQDSVVDRLMNNFSQIKSSRVFRCALWILGEYCNGTDSIEMGIETIKTAVGPLPLFSSGDDDKQEAEEKEENPGVVVKNIVLADGTYATQSSTADSVAKSSDDQESNLRSLLLAGDFFLGSVVCTALTKLVLRAVDCTDPTTYNRRVAEVMLVCCAVIRLGRTPAMPHLTIDEDSYERIVACLRVLSDGDDASKELFAGQCRSSFAMLLQDVLSKKSAADEEIEKRDQVQPDELIHFRHLKTKLDGAEDIDDDVAADLERATGRHEQAEDVSKKLSKIIQLTGFSDAVYAEAYVTVHQYDIVLDVLVLNQTEDTLQNMCIELATMGDLKLCERPQNHTLGPYDSRQIKANIKVSSTETGVIFGNIVFERAGAAATTGSDRSCVILNDIHIDIMDYITPSTCDDVAFRSMWAEFEWENKVAVNTSIGDPQVYLAHILKSTNMACLTPQSALTGESTILAANLYAKSIFGEDALANLSVEKQASGALAGYIRIRSKTQGIALSLGDKITLKQRKEGA
jgi:coatomer subunit beta